MSRLRAWVFHHDRFGWLAGCLFTTLAGLLFCNPFFNQNLVHFSYDLPLIVRTPPPCSDIVVVYMDEDSREALGLRWDQPWDRNLHVQLLERLKSEGARTVVFDILFSALPATNAVPDAATQRLAAAMRAYGRVVIASHLLRTGQKSVAVGHSMEAPDERLAQAAAGVGIAETIEDADTVVRRFWLKFPELGGRTYTTLAREAVRVAASDKKNDYAKLPTRGWINYYGEPGKIQSISYAQALKGVPKGFFRNKIVVVGEYYPTDVSGVRTDTFRSLFVLGPSGDSRFPGAEIHATIIANLLRHEWLQRTPPAVELLLLLAVGFGAGGLLPRLKPVYAVATGVAFIALLVLLAFQLHWRAGLWFPWLIPVLIQMPVAVAWAVLWKTMRASLEAEFLQHSLSLFLSPNTVRSFLRQPELLRPGGERRRVSILGSDIANFSKISNRMDAEDLLALLNQYYEQVIQCIHATDGTVIELIGDAIFAVWNAPQEQPDHPDRMLRTALLLQSKFVELNDRLDLPPLFTRLGLHSGDVCVGNVGSTTHVDYTAVGQAVNLAFRLESFNKQVGTRVLASRDFLKGVTVEYTSRMLGHFRFKGFDGVCEVHELLGGPEIAESTKPWRESFARAVHHLHRRAFNEAEAALHETLKLQPDDGPSKFLLEQVALLRTAGLKSDWAGEIDLDQK